MAGSVFIADLVAVEEKSWWRWAWDAVTSFGADTSHYVVHMTPDSRYSAIWPLWLGIVAVGAVVAWRVGRQVRRAD